MPKTEIDFQNIKRLDKEMMVSNPVIGEPIELTEAQEKRIKKTLKREWEAWESDTSELQEKLRHWFDLSEGIIEETNWPYEGAFETHIDMIGIYLKVYHSIERRSILGSENIWYAEADPDFDQLEEFLPEVESMLNTKSRGEWNIEETLPQTFHCANRDGLSALKIPYVLETEHVEDKIVISNVSELMEDLGSPEEAGLSQKDWDTLLQMVQTEATDETPLEIPVEYDRITYEGPKAYLVERANLALFPATAQSLNREYCRGYGDRFYIRREEVRRKMESEEWEKEACEEFLKKTRIKNSSDMPEYILNKENAVGISRSEKSDSYEFIEVVYRMRLENKGIENTYHFIYTKEHDLLMMKKVYPYRVDYFAIFRIESRSNQFDGKSIPGQLEFLNEAIDLNYNQRFQSREITNVPSFKGQLDMKAGRDGFDPEAEENQWRPGVIFWLKNPDLFEQFQVQPIDQGQSMQEDQNLFRIASWIMGIDVALFSGQTPVGDPNAPGNKTGMLISMGNLRMEDPIAELRYGVEQVGQICLSHLYQFGPSMISYKTPEGTKSFKKRILRQGLKIRMQGVTVVMNSDAEFQKWVQIRAVSLTEPLVAQNAKYRIEPLRRAFRASRIPNLDKLLPSPQEVEQMEQQQKMMMEQQLLVQQKEKQGSDQLDNVKKMQRAQEGQLRLSKVKDDAATSAIRNKARVTDILTKSLLNRVKENQSNGSNQ